MSLLQQNTIRWQNCRVSAAKGPAFESAAKRILANKAVYVDIENELKKMGHTCPWWFIGVVHLRESNLNMNTNIANGQRFDRKTTIVPKGRGPFKSFKDAAIDALVNCAPKAALNKDWSAGNALTILEGYNGLGYYRKGLPSPYIWAGTDQYVKGKYVADGVFDPNVVDSQLGCAGVLKFLGVFNKGTGAATAAVLVGAGTAAATAPQSYWTMFTDHWILYSIGIAVIALAIDFAIYKFRNRKTTNA